MAKLVPRGVPAQASGKGGSELPGTEALPAASEVVVIGGGIAGVATAYYLAKAGVPVTLCEEGRIAGAVVAPASRLGCRTQACISLPAHGELL